MPMIAIAVVVFAIVSVVLVLDYRSSQRQKQQLNATGRVAATPDPTSNQANNEAVAEAHTNQFRQMGGAHFG